MQRDQSIIIFHGIGPYQRTLEPGEDVFWMSRARFCDTLDMIADLGAAAPVITFDDGNASDIEIALPELEARNLKAVFFILTGRLDTPGSLRTSDVVTLKQAGHDIGLHGHDHVDWRQLSGSSWTREFVEARSALSDIIGQEVETAAAPFGYYNRQTVRDLKRLGFETLYTSDRGRAGLGQFLRPRNCLEGAMSDSTLRNALLGRVEPARKVRRVIGMARKRLLPIRTTS